MHLSETDKGPIPLVLLGCGRLGSAVLEGILTNIDSTNLISDVVVAVRLQQSITPLSRPDSQRNSIQRDYDLVKELLSLIGQVIWVAEEDMNVAGVLCASSLAYFATIFEAASKVDGKTKGSLDQETMTKMVVAAAKGTALLMESGDSAEGLCNAIVSPGGSTSRGIEALEKKGVADGMRDVVCQTARAAAGLALK